MKKTLALSLSLASLLAAPIAMAQTVSVTGATVVTSPYLSVGAPFRFTKNLGLGSTGEAVKQLQILLNANPATAVATGARAGAAGRETTAFGPATMTAVKAFQRAHGIEATGFVGPLTRTELNAVYAAAHPSLPTVISVSADTSVFGQAVVSAKYDGGGEKPTIWLAYGVTPSSMTLLSKEAVSESVIGSTSLTISNLGADQCWAQFYIKTGLGITKSDPFKCSK